MGHNTLSRIPGHKYWRDVAGLLATSVSNQEVISASAKAAERDMLRAANDPVFVEAVRLMLAIPAAARSDDFADALRKLDLNVTANPELMELIVATTQRLDQVARAVRMRTDFGEIAARALVSTLSTAIGDALPGLFEASPADVQAVARRLSWSAGISDLSRRFYGALVGETLSYWLDRTLDTHVGPEGRFANAADRSSFDLELDQFTFEATRIIKEFSGGWYGKTLHTKGSISSPDAAIFGAVALKKIVEELRLKQARHA
ncbi:MAG: hypothetical protein CMH12_10655 [Maritimibacter sp.]|nr:hypothetical protein [Maritimibacter sp.]